MKTFLPSPARPLPSYWDEGLQLTLAVLRRAKCAPDVRGGVEETLIAHKLERDRASNHDDAQPEHRS